jgi:hypothetical protein
MLSKTTPKSKGVPPHLLTELPAKLLNKFDVAGRLQVNEQTVLKWTRLGKLQCIKLGSRSYRYAEAQVAAFLANLTGGKR